MKVFKKIWSMINTIFIILIAVLMIFVVVTKMNNSTPTVFGYNLYYVVSGSMEPKLQVGDVVLSKKVSPQEIKVGDIVTYMGEKKELEGKLVTHEVVQTKNTENETYVVTKGTSNITEDPEIEAKKIKSVMVCKVPFLGSIMKALSQKIIFFLAIILPLILILIYEVVMFIMSCKKSKE